MLSSFLRRCLCLTLLAFCLNACTLRSLFPTDTIVQEAIALQLHLTQESLVQKLGFEGDRPEILVQRVRLQTIEPMKIRGLVAYRVAGTYDLAFDLSRRPILQTKRPFEVYLQLQREGKTWRLALPDRTGDRTAWRTYFLH